MSSIHTLIKAESRQLWILFELIPSYSGQICFDNGRKSQGRKHFILVQHWKKKNIIVFFKHVSSVNQRNARISKSIHDSEGKGCLVFFSWSYQACHVSDAFHHADDDEKYVFDFFFSLSLIFFWAVGQCYFFHLTLSTEKKKSARWILFFSFNIFVLL